MGTLLASLLALSVGTMLWNGFVFRKMPGPLPLPFVGNIPFLIGAPWVTFTRWARKYGNMYKLYVPSSLAVLASAVV